MKPAVNGIKPRLDVERCKSKAKKEAITLII